MNRTLVALVLMCTANLFAGTPLYYVIDLRGGPSAKTYPVKTLDAVPSGGWTKVDKTLNLVLRRIDAGKFMSGSPTNEVGRMNAEDQRLVTIDKPFYIGVFEVTQAQYLLVTGIIPASHRGFSNPVENVSWDMIRGSGTIYDWPKVTKVDPGSFVGKLRAKTNMEFDLPTDAQWEYACRAGTKTALNNGKDLVDGGNDPSMSQVGRYWFNGGETSGHAEVGSYQPNAYGLYDMHGNVWEWCLDVSGVQTVAFDPSFVKAKKGGVRLRSLRGGGWFYGAGYCRSASHFSGPSAYKNGDYGFRIVCPAKQP